MVYDWEGKSISQGRRWRMALVGSILFLIVLAALVPMVR